VHQPLILPTLRSMLIWSCRYTQFANQYLDCSIDIVALAGVDPFVKTVKKGFLRWFVLPSYRLLA